MPLRNLRQRVSPHRRWLCNRSEIGIVSVSHGHDTITSAALSSELATRRLSCARARRTRLASSSARMCWAGAIVAVALISPPCSPNGELVDYWARPTHTPSVVKRLDDVPDRAPSSPPDGPTPIALLRPLHPARRRAIF